MHCAACVATVENALRKINGVEDVIINLTMGSARVVGSASENDLLTAVLKTGYGAKSGAAKREYLQHDKNTVGAKNNMVTSWAITAPAMVLMVAEIFWQLDQAGTDFFI